MGIIVVVVIVGRPGAVRQMFDVADEWLTGDDEIQSTLEPFFMAQPVDQTRVGCHKTRAVVGRFILLRRSIQAVLRRLAV